jgi:putative transposase
MANIKPREVSEEFWRRVEPLIPRRKRDRCKNCVRRKGGGRKPMLPRKIFEAIVYVLRTGVQWKALPKEFGSSSSVRTYFQEWERAGFFRKIWKKGLVEYDEMKGIAWEWQSIDGAMTKAPLSQEAVGHNPTDRGGGNGTKRHILADEHGLPLSIVVTGANRHDVSQLEEVLNERIIDPKEEVEENLCADAGYRGEQAKQTIGEHGFIPRIRSRGDEKVGMKAGYRPHRWIVEVAHSWFNRFRKILVRFEKKSANYEALLHLAASIIIYRKIGVIYG